MKQKFLNNLANFFQFKANATNFRTESLAGFTTFLTMAYVIFVNPAILASAGINPGAAFVATCLASAIGCFLIGLMANYPIAIAPGMGLNAYFTYVVVQSLHFSWQDALGMVFIAGGVFFLLTMTQARIALIKAIPASLVIGIGAGIGFFLALIALKNATILVPNAVTFLQLGNLHSLTVLLFLLSFVLIIVLYCFQVVGAIIISILMTTLLSLLFHISHYQGIFALPPSLAPTFNSFSIVGVLHRADLVVVLSFLLVSLFDTTGTLVGVLQGTQFTKDPKRIKRLSHALFADSISVMAGSVLGTSTTTPYVESASGVRAGGRTGFTAIVVGVLFLFALLLAPLAKTMPMVATAPALLFVACLMVSNLSQMNWQDSSESIPGILTAMMIPFSFSIANGVGVGIICYVLIKLLCGKYKELNLLLVLLAFIFLLYFIFNPMV